MICAQPRRYQSSHSDTADVSVTRGTHCGLVGPQTAIPIAKKVLRAASYIPSSPSTGCNRIQKKPHATEYAKQCNGAGVNTSNAVCIELVFAITFRHVPSSYASTRYAGNDPGSGEVHFRKFTHCYRDSRKSPSRNQDPRQTQCDLLP